MGRWGVSLVAAVLLVAAYAPVPAVASDAEECRRGVTQGSHSASGGKPTDIRVCSAVVDRTPPKVTVCRATVEIRHLGPDGTPTKVNSPKSRSKRICASDGDDAGSTGPRPGDQDADPTPTKPPSDEPNPNEPRPTEPPRDDPTPTEPPRDDPTPTEPPRDDPTPTEPPRDDPTPTEPPRDDPTPTEPPRDDPTPTQPPRDEPRPSEPRPRPTADDSPPTDPPSSGSSGDVAGPAGFSGDTPAATPSVAGVTQQPDSTTAGTPAPSPDPADDEPSRTDSPDAESGTSDDQTTTQDVGDGDETPGPDASGTEPTGASGSGTDPLLWPWLLAFAGAIAATTAVVRERSRWRRPGHEPHVVTQVHGATASTNVADVPSGAASHTMRIEAHRDPEQPSVTEDWDGPAGEASGGSGDGLDGR